MDSVKTVAVMLGPYRNLCTLTACVLALHPRIQVLNHAGIRVFGQPEIDFTLDFSKSKLDAFCQFALEASRGEGKGAHGGSITSSNAFNKNEKIRQTYDQLYGSGGKEKITCLVWKEPQRLAFNMRKNNFDFQRAFAEDKRLKLFLPVRNLLDCACSNFISGHYTIGEAGLNKRTFSDSGEKKSQDDKMKSKETRRHLKEIMYSEEFWGELRNIVEVIIYEHKFAIELQKQYPERVFVFYQNDNFSEILPALIKIMDLEMPQANLAGLFDIRPGTYNLTEEIKNYTRERIRFHFDDLPEYREKMLNCI